MRYLEEGSVEEMEQEYAKRSSPFRREQGGSLCDGMAVGKTAGVEKAGSPRTRM